LSRDRTATLREGDPAPDFSLTAASGRTVILAETLKRSALLLVFLRGTL